MEYEICCSCGEHTGRAGAAEDSIYFNEVGPFCEDCYDDIRSEIEYELAIQNKLWAGLCRVKANVNKIRYFHANRLSRFYGYYEQNFKFAHWADNHEIYIRYYRFRKYLEANNGGEYDRLKREGGK